MRSSLDVTVGRDDVRPAAPTPLSCRASSAGGVRLALAAWPCRHRGADAAGPGLARRRSGAGWVGLGGRRLALGASRRRRLAGRRGRSSVGGAGRPPAVRPTGSGSRRLERCPTRGGLLRRAPAPAGTSDGRRSALRRRRRVDRRARRRLGRFAARNSFSSTSSALPSWGRTWTAPAGPARARRPPAPACPPRGPAWRCRSCRTPGRRPRPTRRARGRPPWRPATARCRARRWRSRS